MALESQRFFLDDSGFTFVFERCGPPLRAFRARYARLRSLARSMAMARLEADGEYDEARHDAIFLQLRQSPLAAAELAAFPDYLVRVRESEMDAAARAELVDLLASGMPAKILVQTDDLLEESSIARDGHFALGMRAKQLANMAIGLNDVYVLQSSGSNLFQFRERILKGMAYAGPALFSVYSGACGASGGLPPYLAAAAAMESRAFPAYSYDPSAGPNWASRFHLEANSQAEADWPVQEFSYEDENHQRSEERRVGKECRL